MMSETCQVAEKVYGIAERCLPHTGSDVLPLALLGLGFVLMALGLMLLLRASEHNQELERAALARARDGMPL